MFKNFKILFNCILKDCKNNKGNYKSIFILIFYRLSSIFGKSYTKNRFIFYLGFPIWVPYRILIDWIMGIEIPMHTNIGPGLILHHGQGLVINAETVIGKNCLLRHNTTIGCKIVNNNPGKSPIIGDNVDIGSNSVILGEINIGSNSVVGAGSVVLKNIDENEIFAGNPAVKIK